MLTTFFTDRQFFPLLVSSLILFGSIVAFHFDKKPMAILLLFSGSLGLGFFIANLDNFLILWDEQYHALVAKHMLENPFKPTLYSNPILDYDYKNWAANHIWVHKQPLFLWQMALCLKIFGINELSIRIPSIFLHAITTLFIYRIGKIAVSQNVGFYGALFFSVAYYPLEMVAGKFPTDHNDLVFTCYVAASFWAWFEYISSQKKIWLLCIGLFAGCALLVKWLPGLLVYACWFISIVLSKNLKQLRLSSLAPMLISFSISLVVAIPWQIYIFSKFPVEANREYMHNLRHFTEALDGHGGTIWFHFNAFREIYGSGILVPVFYLAGLFLLIKRARQREMSVAILSAIVLTYAFYSMAQTKMVAFCLIVSPFFYLGLATLVDWVLQKIKDKPGPNVLKRISGIIVIVVLAAFIINLKKIQNYHTFWKPNDNCNRIADLEQMRFIHKVQETLPSGNYVVFNADVRVNGHIPMMFYTDYVAYDFVPALFQIEKVKSKSYKVAILDSDDLPDYIRNDNEIIKIKL